MRRVATVVGVVVLLVGWSAPGMAQPAAGPTIQHVTLHEGTGVLTMRGTGCGEAPVVTVDGYAVVVLPGGTDTELAVAVPAVLGYNYLLGRNKLIMERVKLFANDLEQVIVSGSRVEGSSPQVITGVKK